MSDLGPWHLVGRSTRFSPGADEGLATVSVPGRRHRTVYRGGGSWALLRLKWRLHPLWVHIGDPDSRRGVLWDCFQGPSGATTKMFRATEPDGARRQYVHALDPDEEMNNSFVAVAPDSPWMLSGEWGTIRRFLVFPTPVTGAGPTLGRGADLELDHPVRNVQGAVFIDDRTLLCSTDDQTRDLWPVPAQLLQVDLPRPLDGQPMTGAVTCLGPLPLESHCHGTFEVEGIDYDDTAGELRVEVDPPAPCAWAVTTIYHYRRS